MISWKELLASSVELAELRTDAASIAKLERWPWYERWLPGSSVFRGVVSKVARRLDEPPDEVKHVALTGLLDAYHTAKRRLQRR
jgi:hypothetical protein